MSVDSVSGVDGEGVCQEEGWDVEAWVWESVGGIQEDGWEISRLRYADWEGVSRPDAGVDAALEEGVREEMV